MNESARTMVGVPFNRGEYRTHYRKVRSSRGFDIIPLPPTFTADSEILSSHPCSCCTKPFDEACIVCGGKGVLLVCVERDAILPYVVDMEPSRQASLIEKNGPISISRSYMTTDDVLADLLVSKPWPLTHVQARAVGHPPLTRDEARVSRQKLLAMLWAGAEGVQ